MKNELRVISPHPQGHMKWGVGRVDHCFFKDESKTFSSSNHKFINLHITKWNSNTKTKKSILWHLQPHAYTTYYVHFFNYWNLLVIDVKALHANIWHLLPISSDELTVIVNCCQVKYGVLFKFCWAHCLTLYENGALAIHIYLNFPTRFEGINKYWAGKMYKLK